jgi:hypothetical protein
MHTINECHGLMLVMILVFGSTVLRRRRGSLRSPALSCVLGRAITTHPARREAGSTQHLRSWPRQPSAMRGKGWLSSGHSFFPPRCRQRLRLRRRGEKKRRQPSLILQTISFLCFAKQPSTVTISGGTRPESSFHYLRRCSAALSAGSVVDLSIEKWGW